MAKVQREIHFTGRVQGVGFRYTTLQISKAYDVTGFVQNLSDGRVLLVVEGESSEIDRFLDEVTEHLGQFVTETSSNESPAAGRFDTFDIRH